MKDMFEEYGAVTVVIISVIALSTLLFTFIKPDNPLGNMIQQLLTGGDV